MGYKASIFLGVCAHVVPVYAASFLVPFATLRRNWLFVLLSIWSAVVPAIALAFISTDFSSLVGGMIATALVSVLAKFKVSNELASCPAFCVLQRAVNVQGMTRREQAH